MAKQKPFEVIMEIEPYCLHNEETGEVCMQINRKQELVRCKDCEHYYCDADTGMACEFTNMSQPEDGFCNWAERKDKDDG